MIPGPASFPASLFSSLGFLSYKAARMEVFLQLFVYFFLYRPMQASLVKFRVALLQQLFVVEHAPGQSMVNQSPFLDSEFEFYPNRYSGAFKAKIIVKVKNLFLNHPYHLAKTFPCACYLFIIPTNTKEKPGCIDNSLTEQYKTIPNLMVHQECAQKKLQVMTKNTLADPRVAEIEEEPIELYKILKLENLVQSGGEAKFVIVQGFVQVNGEVETRKRKKVFAGDVIEFEGEKIQLVVK